MRVNSIFVHNNTFGWEQRGNLIFDQNGHVIARCRDEVTASVLMRGVSLQRLVHENKAKEIEP